MERLINGATALVLVLLFTVFPVRTLTQRAPAPPPEGETVLERWRETGDRPDEIRVDISLPMVRETLSGAGEINGQIDANYSYDLGRKTGDYDMDWGFAYPMRHIRYEVHRFGGIDEICVIGEMYSLYGSGPAQWVNRYYYDAVQGRAAAESEFLAAVGYTEQAILEAFCDQMIMEDDTTAYTYDDIRNCYYVDADRTLQFWVSLYA